MLDGLRNFCEKIEIVYYLPKVGREQIATFAEAVNYLLNSHTTKRKGFGAPSKIT